VPCRPFTPTLFLSIFRSELFLLLADLWALPMFTNQKRKLVRASVLGFFLPNTSVAFPPSVSLIATTVCLLDESGSFLNFADRVRAVNFPIVILLFVCRLFSPDKVVLVEGVPAKILTLIHRLVMQVYGPSILYTFFLYMFDFYD